jgi:putative ABC transport system permease protein
MDGFNILRTRLRALLRRESILQDIEEELRIHIEMETEQNIERGMTPDEAQVAARKSFGNPGRNTELSYDIRGGGWLEALWQDLRYGMRMLMKSPGFTLVAVVTLALGIGSNTAIFSVVNAVLLRPLPYSQPERLVFVYNFAPGLGLPKSGLMAAEFLRLRDQARSVEHVALYTSTTLTLTGVGEPERLAAGTASADFFAALGVVLPLGRGFRVVEEPRGQDGVVILSDGLWRRKFSADPGALGQTLTLEGRTHTIVGVLPPGFKSPLEFQAEQPVELWVPPSIAGACCSHDFSVVARLRPGQALAQAQAEADTLMAGVKKDYPAGYPKTGGKQVIVRPLQHEILGDLRRALWVLLAAVLFVLLIACANVANLLLARSEARRKEIAIRAALGAGRTRLVCQLLVESLLLSAIGGGLGLLLAAWGLKLLPVLGAQQIPRLHEITLDARVLGFTLFVALLTSVIFGLAPALQAVKFDLHTGLKEGARAATSAQGRSRLRAALVVLEVTLSLVLLLGAGLLIRSFWHLQQADPGFKVEQLLTMRLFPPASTYPNDQRVAAFYEELLGRVRSLPGVKDAAVVDALPIAERTGGTVLETEGQPVEVNPLNSVGWRVVTPGFFRTLGMRLLRGRLLEEADQEQTAAVAVINETLARAHWPNEDPLGRRIRLLNRPPKQATTVFLTVVGVVADVKGSLTEAARQEVFVPLRQRTAAIDGMGLERQMSLAVRTSIEPMRLVPAIRQEIAALDRTVPVTGERTVEEILSKMTARARFNTTLLGSFAAIALLLAAVGIYGVLSYSVTQRTHEIGIRLALGAQARDMLWLVVKQGLSLALLGVALGLVASFGLTRLLATLLFGVGATDPPTFAGIALLLTGVALLACYIPARRATKVDPLVALRHE